MRAARVQSINFPDMSLLYSMWPFHTPKCYTLERGATQRSKQMGGNPNTSSVVAALAARRQPEALGRRPRTRRVPVHVVTEAPLSVAKLV